MKRHSTSLVFGIVDGLNSLRFTCAICIFLNLIGLASLRKVRGGRGLLTGILETEKILGFEIGRILILFVQFSPRKKISIQYWIRSELNCGILDSYPFHLPPSCAFTGRDVRDFRR